MTRPAHVPAHLVVDYEAFGTEAPEELMAQVEQWRAIGPVVWTDRNGGHWVVISEPGVRTVLEDTQSFISSAPGRGVTLITSERPLHVPIEMDGAEHREYRKILMPLFSPGRVQLLQDTVRELCRALIDEIAARGECDVVTDFARPIASTMFLQMVDWPLEDRFQLEAWVEQSLNGRPGASLEELGRLKVEALASMAEYAEARIDERRGGSRDDMTTTIMNATLRSGDPIPDDKLVRMMVLLLLAGLDTTQSVLSRSLDFLGTHPEQQAQVRAAGADLTQTVEELVRYHTPAVPNRTAVSDKEIEGVLIKAGDTVQCLLGAANRDGGAFADPLTVDFDRPINRHVAFSAGPHKCIGSALARIILSVALEEFHKSFSDYRVVESQGHIGSVWGMNSVHLAVEPAAIATA
ncbi:cytochrome P450 [Rhodococcus olei]|uniref:Cytochrome P450 n=1 Tax=Rhodococcus olei TaxID=2161675 RepID=A0ABP8NYX0_9NOCA